MHQDQQIITPQATESNQPVQSHPVIDDKPKSKKLLVSLLTIILIAAAGAGGYVYGKSQAKPAAVSQSPAVSTPKVSTTTADSVHFVRSAGYPFDLAAKKVFTTKLGLPAELQGVRISSNNNNHGPEQYFTDKYNDELGRWVIGDPTDSAANGGGSSEVSVLALSKSWLGANLPKDLAGNSEFATGYKLNSTADKQKFLQTIKTNTDACVKDPKKGFTTTDSSFKVCYTLNFGKEAYSPRVSFSGYGEKETVPMFLTGLIIVHDDTPMADQTAELKAISDGNSGKYTTKFSKSLNSILAALKETSLTSAGNTAVTQ
jgi:hypothetical protein